MRLVYVPLYLPSTRHQLAAHMCLVLAAVLLVVAFSTRHWTYSQMTLPAKYNMGGLEITIQLGLESVSIRECELPPTMSGSSPPPPTCTDMDLSFSECTPVDLFCEVAPSARACMGLVVSAFIVAVVGEMVGLARPPLHAILVGVCMLLVSVAQIVYASVTHHKYSASLLEQERRLFAGQTYYYQNHFGYSFALSCVANGLLCLGTGVSYQAYWVHMPAKAAREINDNSGQQSGVMDDDDEYEGNSYNNNNNNNNDGANVAVPPLEDEAPRSRTSNTNASHYRYSPAASPTLGDDSTNGEFTLTTSVPPQRSPTA
eukprot:PhM_4_TR17949/c0_g1_i1/m.18137